MKTFSKTEFLALYPNMQVWHTGGGCMAYQHPLDDGGYLLITDESDLPEDGDTQVYVGRYDAEGECVGGDSNTPRISVADLETWIDAQFNLTHKVAAAPLPESEKGGPEDIEARLSDILRLWCEQTGLPFQSADELLNSIIGTIEAKPARIAWLRAYINLWDVTVS